MQKIWMVLFCSMTFESIAQSDHLKPVTGIFASYDFDFEYSAPLRTLLYRNLDRRFIARVIVTPSFQPEYLLCIENQKDSIIMIYNVLSDVFWVSKDTLRTKVITHRVRVDKQFSDIIQQTFNYFLVDTHYPKESDDGADGVTYQFMTHTNGVGIRAGEVWSPQEKTKLRKLTDLSDLLKNICINHDFLKQKEKIVIYCNSILGK